MNKVQSLGEYEPQFREILGKALDKTIYADVTAPGTPDTEFQVQHELGYIPNGYLVISKDRAADVYLSTTAATTAILYLKSTVASAVLKVMVF